MKNKNLKNFLMAILLGAMTLGSMAYYSLENSALEVALQKCRQSKQDIRANDCSNKLTKELK